MVTPPHHASPVLLWWPDATMMPHLPAMPALAPECCDLEISAEVCHDGGSLMRGDVASWGSWNLAMPGCAMLCHPLTRTWAAGEASPLGEQGPGLWKNLPCSWFTALKQMLTSGGLVVDLVPAHPGG